MILIQKKDRRTDLFEEEVITPDRFLKPVRFKSPK
jgi:hypothetical protein